MYCATHQDSAYRVRELASELRARYGIDAVGRAVPLAMLGRWRIGGPADLVLTPRSGPMLAAMIGALRSAGARYVVIGDGSNMLFDDAGYRGAIVRIGRAMSGIRRVGEVELEAGAGAWVPAFVHRTIGWGLGGAVHAIGIPGSLGGLVAMNGGSQRRGIGERVVEVAVIDRDGTERRIAGQALGFGYRRSALQDSGCVVISARFRFERANPTALRREAIAMLAARRAKFPRVGANCGSVFVSDPALYATLGSPGVAIEATGLKGRAIGGARIAREHANFIVNEGGATARDVLALIALARNAVAARSGITMAAEVRFLPAYGIPVPAHEALA